MVLFCWIIFMVYTINNFLCKIDIHQRCILTKNETSNDNKWQSLTHVGNLVVFTAEKKKRSILLDWVVFIDSGHDTNYLFVDRN